MSESVGKVKEQVFKLPNELLLECGKTLKNIDLTYETYGELNSNASNAVLICHALSGNHHAAGYHEDKNERLGWWDALIGPNKAIDTNKYFVVCPNNIGGCHGSTGPSSINPVTQRYYGPDFPVITVKDWVNSQAQLADYLNIKCWHAAIGGSLGGMQALEWSRLFPDRISKAAVIAAAPKLSAQNIAFNEVARQAIITDPDFQEGNYGSRSIHMNLFSINEHVCLIDPDQTFIRAELEKHHIMTKEVKLPHGKKLGGAHHCTTLDLLRTS